DRVIMMEPVKAVTIGREQVYEKFGVPPELVVDAQALIGDTADNVPGAPGIGVKTAAQLLAEYGSLDALLDRAHEIKQPKRREALTDFRDQILLSRELVKLRDDVPPPFDIDSFALKDPNADDLIPFLNRMEFATLARRMGGAITALEEARLDAAKTPAAPISRPLYGNIGEKPVTSVIEPFTHESYVCVQDIDILKTYVARAQKLGYVAVDTETDDLSATHSGLVGVSLSLGANDACYIPLGHESDDGLAFGDALLQIPMDEAMAVLKPLLEDPSVLKIGQNIKYDLSVLKRHGINVAPYDDTMLISYVLEGGLHGHGMDTLSELHLGHTPITFKQVAGTGKAAKSFKYVGLVEATKYAAEDADVTLRLWRLLKPRLQENGLLTVYETLERKMPTVLSDMELTGIRIDP
ncbi:MAG: DNA polymerase I, partial [Asticcacaulis sp. 32-58-5]